MDILNLAEGVFIGYAVTVAPMCAALELQFNHELSHGDAPTTSYPLFNSLPVVAQGTAYMPSWVSGRLNLDPILPSSDPF